MKLKKRGAVIAIICMTILLTGCGSIALAEGFDKTLIEQEAAAVVETITERDFAAVNAMLREDLRESLSAEALEGNVGEMLTEAGAFQAIDSTTIVGQKLKDTGEDYAVAVVIVSYENQKIVYTLSFDLQMELIGLFMKPA